jgi:hypothetical protein
VNVDLFALVEAVIEKSHRGVKLVYQGLAHHLVPTNREKEIDKYPVQNLVLIMLALV